MPSIVVLRSVVEHKKIFTLNNNASPLVHVLQSLTPTIAPEHTPLTVLYTILAELPNFSLSVFPVNAMSSGEPQSPFWSMTKCASSLVRGRARPAPGAAAHSLE